MAIEIIRKLICDVGDDRHDGTHTLSFAVSGTTYELDLCDKHGKAFDKAMEPWMTSGRRAQVSRRKAGTTAKVPYDAGAVRSWAKLVGIEVSDTGRIGPTIIKKWRDAGSPGA